MKRFYRTFYRKLGILGAIILVVAGFMLLESDLVARRTHIKNPFKDTLPKQEPKTAITKNDQPTLPEIVDDKKFVVKNITKKAFPEEEPRTSPTTFPKIVDDRKSFIKNIETNKSREPVQVFKQNIAEEKTKKTTKLKRSFQDFGKVNVHVWDSICSFTLNSLKQFPLFPLRAKTRTILDVTDELNLKLKGSWLAQRIMGYLHPPLSGKYQFELSSFLLAELWLSQNEDPANSELISKITRNKIYKMFFSVGENRPKSKTIELRKDSVYYFEVIHVINDVKTKEDHVRLFWKLPDYNDFTSIKKSHVSLFLDNEKLKSRNATDFNLRRSKSLVVSEEDDMSSETIRGFNMKTFRSIISPKVNVSLYSRHNVQHLPYWDRSDLNLALYEAPYEPSYTRKKVYKRYEGVYNTHFSDVFPNDGTLLRKVGYTDPTDRDGNRLIDEKEVFEVLKIFLGQLDRKFAGKYLLEGIINVERSNDSEKGTRYFLELVIRNTKEDKLYKTAEYVYLFKTQPTKLFRPKGLIWDPDVTINVILTVKNQGDWGINFIEDMLRVKDINQDDKLNFIVVDYGGDGIDLEKEFKESRLRNFTIIRRKGAFHKTASINEAVSKITNPNSIVFLMDLHLRMPNNIFDILRKHTIQGLMSFTPIVFRLPFCGRPRTWNTHESGWWETSGYGLFSIYKSDWDRFGGMNVKDFTNKWGGEDWEMVDRVLAKGIEIERLRVPDLYHFFHDKSKMWEKSGH